jgi:glycine oxidase
VRVIIAGGGVIGCSIAYHLQKEGADVVLLERGEIGGEASGAAAGMLIAPFEDAASKDFQALQQASLAMYPAVIEEIESRSGIDVEQRACGIVRTARTEAHAKALRALARRRAKSIAGLEWIEGETLRRLEPGLAPEILGAAYSPEDSNVNPGLLTQAFARAAEALGAQVCRGLAFTGFLGRGPRLEGAHTSNGPMRADAIVLAAGPWTELLARRVHAGVPTPPMRGQMIAYRSTAVRHAVWGEEGYLVPKPRGFIFAGATVEDAGFRKHTTGRGLAGMRRAAVSMAPALRYAEEASTWAGLRPGSPDGLPVLGRLSGRENVYVAAGHFRNGILLAPVTGRLMTQLICDGRAEMDLRPFRPERFG